MLVVSPILYRVPRLLDSEAVITTASWGLRAPPVSRYRLNLMLSTNTTVDHDYATFPVVVRTKLSWFLSEMHSLCRFRFQMSLLVEE